MEKTSKFCNRCLLACLLAAIILTSAAGCQAKVEQTSASVEDDSITVETQTPQVGDMALTTEFIGTIEPDEQVSVMPKVGGTVLRTYAEVGQTVKKGDLLFEIDPVDIQLQVNIAQAAVNTTQAAMDQALGSSFDLQMAQLENQVKAAQNSYSSARQTLRDYNDGEEDTLDYYANLRDKTQAELVEKNNLLDDLMKKQQENPTAETAKQIEVLKGQIAGLEEQYSMYRANYNEYDDDDPTRKQYRTAQRNAELSYDTANQIYAITKDEVFHDMTKTYQAQLDQALASYDSASQQLAYTKVYSPIDGVIEQKNVTEQAVTSQSTVAYTVSNKSTIMVTFYVPSGAVEQMVPGDAVTIENGRKSYTGSIAEVGTMVDPQTGLFKVKAQVNSDDGSLQTGLSVKVTATTGRAQQSLLLPQDDIYYEDGEAYVYLDVDGTAVRTPIETGLSNDETVEVVSGLTANAQVITSWNANLTDGVKVRGADEPAAPQDSSSEPASSEMDVSAASDESASLPASSAAAPSGNAEASLEG